MNYDALHTYATAVSRADRRYADALNYIEESYEEARERADTKRRQSNRRGRPEAHSVTVRFDAELLDAKSARDWAVERAEEHWRSACARAERRYMRERDPDALVSHVKPNR